MRVLVACEFSEIVKEQFLLKGHDAHSCDLLPGEKGLPNHHQRDVLEILNNGWDLMIAHPPCTFLCRNRMRQNKEENRDYDINQAKQFFMRFVTAPIERICIENPVPSKQSGLPPYSQIIQPYYFGHDYSKKTCLWLKNLPLLTATEAVELTYITTPNGYRYTRGWYEMPRKTKDRSRTFQGIAEAMSEQWGDVK